MFAQFIPYFIYVGDSFFYQICYIFSSNLLILIHFPLFSRYQNWFAREEEKHVYFNTKVYDKMATEINAWEREMPVKNHLTIVSLSSVLEIIDKLSISLNFFFVRFDAI